MKVGLLCVRVSLIRYIYIYAPGPRSHMRASAPPRGTPPPPPHTHTHHRTARTLVHRRGRAENTHWPARTENRRIYKRLRAVWGGGGLWYIMWLARARLCVCVWTVECMRVRSAVVSPIWRYIIYIWVLRGAVNFEWFCYVISVCCGSFSRY